MCLSDPFQALVCVVGLTVARCAVAVTQLFAEEGQGRKFGRYPFRGVQNPLPDSQTGRPKADKLGDLICSMRVTHCTHPGTFMAH